MLLMYCLYKLSVLMLLLDGTASKLLPDQLQFDRENNKDCIVLNVFDYIDRQSDQTMTLKVKSGDSQFKVSGNEATVAVVNDEGWSTIHEPFLITHYVH